MLSCRMSEEKEHKLEVSVYDTVRNEKARKHRLEMERQKEQEERLRKEKEMDYLAPYLAKVGDPASLSSDDAEKVDTDLVLTETYIYWCTLIKTRKFAQFYEKVSQNTSFFSLTCSNVICCL